MNILHLVRKQATKQQAALEREQLQAEHEAQTARLLSELEQTRAIGQQVCVHDCHGLSSTSSVRCLLVWSVLLWPACGLPACWHWQD